MGNEAFKVAARWWADFLRGDFKNKTGDLEIDYAQNVRNCCIPGLKKEKIDEFQEVLARILSEEYADLIANPPPNGKGWIDTGVDYHPMGAITIAAKEVGINLEDRLPLKSNLWIKAPDIRVYAKNGYHQLELLIYPAEK